MHIGKTLNLAISMTVQFTNVVVHLLFSLVLQIGCEERLLKQYCECHVTRTGILTAVQDAGCPHSLVTQLVDEWLDRYRRMDKRREAAACSNYDSDS